MTKAVLVHPDLIGSARDSSLLGAFAPDVKVVNYVEGMSVDAVISSIDSPTVSHLAFIYHHPGSDKLPFFNEPIFVAENQHINKHYHFTDAAIDFIKRVRDEKSAGAPLIVDVLSCNLTTEEYKKEVAELEAELSIDIRYSTDETGNPTDGGNWILESELPAVVNVRTTYFTDAVLKWKGVLNSNIANLVKAGGVFLPFIVWNNTTKTYLLRNNIVWTEFVAATGILVTDFISLGAGETFNGNNKTIDFAGVTGARGIFFGLANTNPRPWIKGLGAIGGTSLAPNAGYLIRDGSLNLYLENCYNTGIVSGDGGGGIAGANFCFNYAVSIMNGCWNTGAITGQQAGGLVGTNANSGGPNTKTNISTRNILMTNCYNSGTISGMYSGGIFGSFAGLTGGQIDMTGCYNSGAISGNYAGGLVGASPAKNGLVFIKRSYNTGAITGDFAGGLIGGYAFNAGNGLITITDSYNIGSVTSGSAAGFVGSSAGQNSTGGDITISKCYNAGALVTNTSVAFIGPSPYYPGTGSIVISNSIANGATIWVGSNNVTITNTSTDLATINGAIPVSWDTSIWSVGGAATVAVAGDTANYLLPILSLFRQKPWGAITNDSRYYSNAASIPAIYLAAISVIVNFNVDTDTSGSINVFSQTAPSVNNIVLATAPLPKSVLYNGPGNGLIKFQGVEDNIVATLDSGFTTSETTIRDAIHLVIRSALNAMDAVPYNTQVGGVRKYADSDYYVVPSFGALALGTYAHYLFGHVQATAAIDNDTIFIQKMNGIDAGTAQIPNGLANQIKTLDNSKSLAIVKQVLGQDATRATNVDNDIDAPSAWQTLEFRTGDSIFFAVVLKTPQVTMAQNAPYVSSEINAVNYVENTYYIKCILE